jgi:hypothetical protein
VCNEFLYALVQKGLAPRKMNPWLETGEAIYDTEPVTGSEFRPRIPVFFKAHSTVKVAPVSRVDIHGFREKCIVVQQRGEILACV